MDDATISRVTTIPERVIHAIMVVESGHDPHAIRFEPNHFNRETAQTARVPYTGPGPSHVRAETDRRAFDRAFTLDPVAAIRASSWGAYQVMGAHLLSIYPDPTAAVEAFYGAPDGLSGALFCRWVKANPRILAPAKAMPPDFEGIAKAYNGAGAAPRYAERLRAAY